MPFVRRLELLLSSIYEGLVGSMLKLVIMRETKDPQGYIQFVIFKPLSYCFKERRDFYVKASFARSSVSGLIKPGNITKEI